MITKEEKIRQEKINAIAWKRVIRSGALLTVRIQELYPCLSFHQISE